MAVVAPLSKDVSVDLLTLDEESSASNSELSRPTLSRRDTEQILDYYQSEDAGRAYVSSRSSYSSDSYPSQREPEALSVSARSTMRPRSAGRDTHEDAGRASMESVASSSGGVQRRTSQRSAGGADKRRLAIVEMDSSHTSQSSTSRAQRSDMSGSFAHTASDYNLYARRGVDVSRLGGLALVSPPDARPFNFTSPSLEPISAPATASVPTDRPTRPDPAPSGHQRSMSDFSQKKGGSGSKTSPRDVGIVGTLGTMLSGSPERKEQLLHPEHRRPSTADGEYRSGKSHSDALTAPVFQTPRSRSPSPLPLTSDPSSSLPTVSGPSLPTRGRTVDSGQPVTPSIGQEKDIGRPVVGPVLLDLSSGQHVTRRSPGAMTSGLPITDPSTTAPHLYGDRDAPRTSGRLPFKPNQVGPSYVYYQPGVHSTAGPLPSPPRHIVTHPSSIPPPRPPRMLSPPPPTRRNDPDHPKDSARPSHTDRLKPTPITSLRPPSSASRVDSDFSISAVSASSEERLPRSSPGPPEEDESASRPSSPNDQTDTKSSSPRNGSHVREGAFPASSVFLSHPSEFPPTRTQHNLDELMADVNESPEEEGPSSSSSVPPSTVVKPPVLKHSHARPNLKREISWVSISAESFGEGPDDASPPSSYPSSGEGSTRVAVTNVASDEAFTDLRRASLPTPPNPPRRFHSLPRTPSLLSMSRPSRSQASSPSSHPVLKKPPSSWPSAMNYQDVLVKKTAAERVLGYAAKIRELATEETGLKEWLLFNARKERREPPPAALPPAAATSRVFSKHPRHVSRGSMASEVTFPIRQDSYTATDLSPRPTTDLSSPTSPPSTLPYPSLAHGVGIRRRPSRTLTTDSSMTSPTNPPRSLGGGFFASIGRKASIRKDRTLVPTSPTKLFPSRQALPPTQPRPVKIETPPTLPGGPRAPPRSAHRAHSVAFASPEPSRADDQDSSIRPAIENKELFESQVEKLSDLLPQADKDILAGYLRRAHDQDPMLAIGTYLDDEKQGCLRRD